MDEYIGTPPPLGAAAGLTRTFGLTMEWILERLPAVIFAVVVLTQIFRAFLRTRRELPPPDSKPDELEAQRRVAEIQEQIRRRIAQRRAGVPAAEPPPLEPSAREHVPERRPIETTQLPDPFEGPLRRVMQEFEKRLPAPAAPPPPPVIEKRHVELERQAQLADEMRLLEEARVLAQRRAAQVSAAHLAHARSEGGLRTAARVRVLDDLRDPDTIRRAIILREVLGPPVALR